MVSPSPSGLTHIAADGSARMVDVSAKPESLRVAKASGQIFLRPETVALIENHAIAKGNVLATARIAGIGAAKSTSALIAASGRGRFGVASRRRADH